MWKKKAEPAPGITICQVVDRLNNMLSVDPHAVRDLLDTKAVCKELMLQVPGVFGIRTLNLSKSTDQGTPRISVLDMINVAFAGKDGRIALMKDTEGNPAHFVLVLPDGKVRMFGTKVVEVAGTAVSCPKGSGK